MLKVTITNVDIKRFRNIHDYSLCFSRPGKAEFITGRNHLGKTNCLHAIMWCLCGCDLYNNSDNAANVPDFDKDAMIRNLVDVSVKLHVGYDDTLIPLVINRVVYREKKSLKEELYINGVLSNSLKDGEIAIDNALQIIPFTIGQPNGFNVRRFLFNPLFLNYVKESDLRSVVISLVRSNDLENEIYRSLGDECKKPFAKDVVDGRFDFGKIQAANALDSKIAKKSAENCAIVSAFLSSPEAKAIGYNADLLSYVEKNRSDACAILIDCQVKQVILDQIAIDLSKKYDDICKSALGVKVQLLEKGVGEDVYKEVCRPIYEHNGYAIGVGSTSERILLATKFCDNLFPGVKFPALIDECETFDSKSIYDLIESKHQIIGTCVSNNDKLELR